MAECLKEMLSLEAQPPIYIILDALDECPVTSIVPLSPREEVLETSCPSPLKPPHMRYESAGACLLFCLLQPEDEEMAG
jgi:hypothetical protein